MLIKLPNICFCNEYDEKVIQSVPKILFISRRRRPSEVLYRVGQIVFHRQLEVKDYRSFQSKIELLKNLQLKFSNQRFTFFEMDVVKHFQINFQNKKIAR